MRINEEKEFRFGPKGFTDKIIEILGKESISIGSSCLKYHTITTEQLLTIQPLLSEDNLNIRQNFSPSVREFMELAQDCPSALFDCRVITKERDDELFAIEGVLLPTECDVDMFEFLERAAERAKWDHPEIFADFETLTPDLEIPNDHGFHRYWWD